MDTLQKYLNTFQKLKQGITKYGKAPHKVILLISVLQIIKNKQISQNLIFVSPELVMLYRTNWNLLVKTPHVCNFALPFWHLKGDGFWKLSPKDGFKSLLIEKKPVSSLGELNSLIDHAKLNQDLYDLINNERNNLILQQFLLNTYFPDSKDEFNKSIDSQQISLNDIEYQILHKDPVEYRKEIEYLIQTNNEVEIFLRGSLFKREIPKIYNNTCCISGMKIDATINVSMIDACHIVPFSESYDDTVTNGIALCPNLHRAFDRGLICIDENYKVVVSNTFIENGNIYSLKTFEGKKIQLPKIKSYYPMKENFGWHRGNIYKA